MFGPAVAAASPDCIGGAGHRPKAERSPASLGHTQNLLADFVRFAGWRRIAAATVLIVIGTGLDGVGIVLLVELFQLFLAPDIPIQGTGELTAASQQRFSGFDRSMLIWLGFAAFAGLAAARFLVLTARDTQIARLQYGFVETIRLQLFERIASASWTRVVKVDQAQLVQMLGTEVAQMAIGLHSALQASVAAIILLGLAVFATVLAPGLTFFTFVFVAALSAGANHLMCGAVASGRTLLRQDLSMASTSARFLHALKFAKAQGAQAPFLKRYAAASAAALRQRIAFARSGSISNNIIIMTALFAAAGAIVTGTSAFEVSPPALVTFTLVLSRMTAPALIVQRCLHQIAHNVPRFELLRSLGGELGEAPSAVVPMSGTRAMPARGCTIRFEHTYFRRMSESEEGLSDLSLVIGAGELVGIAGASGSGKTTLLDLIAGLIEPDGGALSINDEVLSGSVLTDHRANLSYVGAEPLLFVGTLRENLTWSAPDATDKDIRRALDLVGASHLVRRSDQSLDAVIVEGSNRFSAGERQRLALAGAILRRPALMLLDEATSSLDMASERAVIAALRQLRPRPTVLLISHRAESLALCERLVTLEAGRIIDDAGDASLFATAPTKPRRVS
jgi:ATP-binding cassette subfamily C protein